MANEPSITIVGNATGDAELQFLPSGVAVANFTVASTPRRKVGDEWEDGETTFFRCTAWRDMAENVAESVKRGMRLVVTGRLSTRQYETREGEKRTSIELQVDEVGPSLRYATAHVNKADRRQAAQQQQGGDPWATGATPPAPPQGSWGAPSGPPPAWAGQQPQSGGYGQQQPAAPQQQPQLPQQGQPQGWGQGPPAYDEPPF